MSRSFIILLSAKPHFFLSEGEVIPITKRKSLESNNKFIPLNLIQSTKTRHMSLYYTHSWKSPLWWMMGVIGLGSIWRFLYTLTAKRSKKKKKKHTHTNIVILELCCSPLLNALHISADNTHFSTPPNPISSVNSHLHMQVFIELSFLKSSQHQSSAPRDLGCDNVSPHIAHHCFVSVSVGS